MTAPRDWARAAYVPARRHGRRIVTAPRDWARAAYVIDKAQCDGTMTAQEAAALYDFCRIEPPKLPCYAVEAARRKYGWH